LNWYININYVRPEGEKLRDNTARPIRVEPKGSTSTKKVRQRESGEPDFVVETSPCSCESAKLLKLAVDHIAYCELIIKTNCGEKHIPTRPAGL
jgi:hypothetical protein